MSSLIICLFIRISRINNMIIRLEYISKRNKICGIFLLLIGWNLTLQQLTWIKHFRHWIFSYFLFISFHNIGCWNSYFQLKYASKFLDSPSARSKMKPISICFPIVESVTRGSYTYECIKKGEKIENKCHAIHRFNKELFTIFNKNSKWVSWRICLS